MNTSETGGQTSPKLIKPSILSAFFDFSSLFIILISFGLFIYVAFTSFDNSDDKSNTEVIFNTSNANPYDQKQLKTPLDSTLFDIYRINSELRDSLIALSIKLENVKVQNEEEERKLRATGIIIGIIFAITGFFGIKSLNEIREYSLKNAQSDAKEAAKLKAEEVAKSTAEETAKTIAERKAEEVAKEAAEIKAESIAATVSERKSKEIAESVVLIKIAEFRSEVVELRRFIALIRESNDLKNEVNEMKVEQTIRIKPPQVSVETYKPLQDEQSMEENKTIDHVSLELHQGVNSNNESDPISTDVGNAIKEYDSETQTFGENIK